MKRLLPMVGVTAILSLCATEKTPGTLFFQDASKSSQAKESPDSGSKPVTAADSKKTADPAKKTVRKRPVNPALQPIQDVPGLPRVLLIGDSISIGYTVPVRKLLAGEMNVHRPLTNCGPTRNGVLELDRWLHDKRMGKGKWNVIHFNFGLHDLKYMGPNGENLYSPEKGNQQVPLKEYERNLNYIVKELKKTGARLIWRNTTPVPPGAKGRVVGDAARYNAVARKVMNRHDIRIHDMYKQVKPNMDTLMRKANVHFTPAGSQKLAELVVREIRRAVEDRES